MKRLTQEEYEAKLADIKKQEETLGVEISMTTPHDKDHLDSFWYGGEVGTIRFPETGSVVVISANGDIDIFAHINGEDLEFRDKNNGGTAFKELGNILDDCSLIDPPPSERLSTCEDDGSYIIWDNNNWFEANVITADGTFIDMSLTDNILEGDLLDCFLDAEEYKELVDKAEHAVAAREYAALTELARSWEGGE